MGLRWLQREAAFGSATTALTSGVILTAFALYFGANNLVVGVLASAPFLTQLLQAPAVLLVENCAAAGFANISAISTATPVVSIDWRRFIKAHSHGEQSRPEAKAAGGLGVRKSQLDDCNGL